MIKLSHWVKCIVAGAIMIPTWAFPATTWICEFSQAKGEVHFHAIGRPKAIKINGKSEVSSDNLGGRVEFSPSSLSGQIEFTLNALKTGIKLRDRHMKEKYLDTNRHPKAVLKILKIQLPLEFFNQDGFQIKDLPFSGELEVHGVKRMVNGSVNLERISSNALKIAGFFQINITDFEIKIPSFMGVTVAETVHVEVDLQVPINSK